MSETELTGYIAIRGFSPYSHAFGGNSWNIIDTNLIGTGAHLLLNLDLSDPKLQTLQGIGSPFLPVCSYINCDVWVYPQSYVFDPVSRQVEYVDHSATNYFELPEDMAFENPLPQAPMNIREMTLTELVLNERDYWAASDEFLGGKSFIRVLGPPLWIDEPDSVVCECGKSSLYFCSIGYEYSEDYGIFGSQPFFIGEGALYFFICKSCRRVTVESQPS